MKKMYKTGIFVVVGVALLSAVYLLVTLTTEMKEKDDDNLKVITFAVKNGFAYKILINDKVYISQEFVPAVSGLHRFCTEEDAKKTGELVKNKIILVHNPTITLEDIDKLNIALDCY